MHNHKNQEICKEHPNDSRKLPKKLDVKGQLTTDNGKSNELVGYFTEEI